MTRILAAAGIVAIVLSGGAASAGERTVTLAVDNMYCASCPYIVKQSLAKVPGVENVVVSFEKKTATVTYDDERATLPGLLAATKDAGYPSKALP